MPSTGYTFDGTDLWREYECVVQRVTGHMGFPKRKDPTEYSWDGEDGAVAFTDESDITFEPRDITMECYLYATTEANFHAKLSALRSACCATGLHDLKVKHNPNTYNVYYKAGNPFEQLGGWNATKNVGRFYLSFREPKPSYTAIWKGLVAHYKMDSTNEVLGTNIITNAASNSTFNSCTPAAENSQWTTYNNATLGAGTGFITFKRSVESLSGIQLSSAYMTGETHKRTYKVSASIKASTTTANVYMELGAGGNYQKTFAVNSTSTTYSYYLSPNTVGILKFYQAAKSDGKTFTLDNIYVYPVSSDDETGGTDASLYMGDAGAIYTTDRQTTANAALDFDGTNDYIDTGQTFQSTFRNSFSIAFWCKPDDGQPAALDLVCGAHQGSYYVYPRFGTNGVIGISYRDGTTTVLAQTASACFSNGAESWRHVAFVVDNDRKQIDIYFDGAKKALDSTYSGSLAGVDMSKYTSTSNFYIGALNSAGTASDFYAGGIYGFRLYNRAISAEEVNVLYHKYADGTLDF